MEKVWFNGFDYKFLALCILLFKECCGLHCSFFDKSVHETLFLEAITLGIPVVMLMILTLEHLDYVLSDSFMHCLDFN